MVFLKYKNKHARVDTLEYSRSLPAIHELVQSSFLKTLVLEIEWKSSSRYVPFLHLYNTNIMFLNHISQYIFQRN